MIRHISQLLAISIFLISCSADEINETETELTETENEKKFQDEIDTSDTRPNQLLDTNANNYSNSIDHL